MLKYYYFLVTVFIVNIIMAQDNITISDPVSGKVEVSAPVSITLLPGFCAVEGCDFRAYIGANQVIDNDYELPDGPDFFAGIPSSGKNCIKKIIPRLESGSLPDTDDEHREVIQYFDGIGRLIQSIDVHASPDGNDIIQPVKYDKYGRQSEKYLPFASSGNGGYRLDATADALNYYNSTPPEGHSSDNNAKIQITYDNSPLNRVISQTGPGQNWFNTEKQINYDYLTNTGTVGSWKVNSSGSFISISYSANELYLTETKDEDDNTVREYKDKQGKIVQKTSKLGSEWLRTLYIYDDLQRLRCVVPPQAPGPNENELCYYYKYDGRGRMIEKDLPGAEPVYMVYDNRDNLVLAQDGKTRDEEPGYWYFTKYDALNRPVMTGKIYTTNSHIGIRDDFKSYTGVLYETYNGTTGFYGYTPDNSYPGGYDITADDILAVTYYDDYSFVDDLGLGDDYLCSTYNETDFSYTQSGKTRGLTSGIMTKVLTVDGSAYMPVNDELFTVSYYEEYGHIIRTISDNHKGGKDIMSTNYKPITFEIESSLQLHTGIGDDLRIKKLFMYDHTGRLLQITQQVNEEDIVVLSAMKYNEIGELVTKYLHSKDETLSKNYLQKLDFAYNIRGWLKSINNPALSDDNDLYGMQLFYEDLTDMGGIDPEVSYNGNITGIKYSVKDDKIRGYGFRYDEINRLTNAVYADGVGLNQNEGSYSVSIPGYDKNGNILQLKRKYNGQLVDDLAYNYFGWRNQVQTVTDNAGSFPGVDDYPGTSSDYFYDDNGNMTHDGGKDLDIEYNYLNLPEVIDFGGDNKLFYHYDALGNKLVKYKDLAAGTDELSDYIGNIVYNDNEINYILTEEGRITPIGTGSERRWIHEYNLKDHLGNTRLVFSGISLGGSVVVQQEANYYPFGLPISVEDYGASNISEYPDNKYLYNSKEYQDDMLAGIKLDWYDYGARMYDPQLGRWHVVDPLAETYHSWSPYQYVRDNPILRIDPDGTRDDEYIFNKNGKYVDKVEKPGEHTGLVMGSKTQEPLKFKFADPENDPKSIDKGEITGVEVVKDETISEVLEESGVNEKENQDNKVGYIKKESDASIPEGEGKMDYVVTATPKIDGVKQPIRADRLYITKTASEAVAHNNYNFGNFLWGAGANKLGFSLFKAKVGAHYKCLTDPHYKKLDSKDDQYSIKLGYEWSETHK